MLFSVGVYVSFRVMNFAEGRVSSGPLPLSYVPVGNAELAFQAPNLNPKPVNIKPQTLILRISILALI